MKAKKKKQTKVEESQRIFIRLGYSNKSCDLFFLLLFITCGCCCRLISIHFFIFDFFLLVFICPRCLRCCCFGWLLVVALFLFLVWENLSLCILFLLFLSIRFSGFVSAFFSPRRFVRLRVRRQNMSKSHLFGIFCSIFYFIFKFINWTCSFRASGAAATLTLFLSFSLLAK